MKKYLELFLTFFKLGLFTFGGGYAMIPSLKEIVVEKKKWLSEEEMLEILAISESTPGPIAINMATFIGYRQKKVLGSVLSTLGVVLPSLIIIYIISLFFDAFLANEYVASAFIGIKACVAFLITKAGLDMLIKATYDLLGLKTFFTSGTDECRAWTFKDGMKAPECAGIIHTDFQKGFIKAEVMSYEDLESLGSEKAVQEAGKLRLEGKEYIMKDGDICFFRFNVTK